MTSNRPRVIELREAPRLPCEVPGCGELGRLYPCGWRCDRDSPGAVREAQERRAAGPAAELAGAV